MPRPRSSRITVCHVNNRRVKPWALFWRAYDEKTGTRKRDQLYFATEAEARAQAAKIEAQLAKLTKPTPLPTATATVGTHLEEWLTRIVGRGKASSAETYGTVVRKHIIPVVGDLEIATFGPHEVSLVVETMHRAGLSRGYQKLALLVLSSGLTVAIEWKRLATNPCRGILRRLKLPTTRQRPNPFTFAEMEAFLSFIQTGHLPAEYDPTRPREEDDGHRSVDDGRLVRRHRRHSTNGYPYWYAFFVLLFNTGLRRGEATGLTWNRVFLDTPKPYLRVEQTFSAAARRAARRGDRQHPVDGLTPPKTPGSVRKVWLNPEAVEVLRGLWRVRKVRAFREQREQPFVFVGPVSGGRIEAAVVNKVFETAVAAIGRADYRPRFTMHCTRDTFATVHLEVLKTPLGWVSAMLGHQHKSTTLDIYSRYLPDNDPVDHARSLMRPGRPIETDETEPTTAKVSPFQPAADRPK